MLCAGGHRPGRCQAAATERGAARLARDLKLRWHRAGGVMFTCLCLDTIALARGLLV
jgi:hypothetical protein